MKKNTKTYTIDLKKYKLNIPYLKEAINSYMNNNKIKSKYVLYKNIDEELGIAASTIRSWLSSNNSPKTIDDIKNLSSFLGVSNYKSLLIEFKEEIDIKNETENKKMNKATDRQKNALRRIYVAVTNYLNEFEKSDGFNNYWYEFRGIYEKASEVEDALYDIAEKEVDKVLLAIKCEYLDLYNLDNIYENLIDFVWDVLYESFNGKVSYAYRFEAGVENVDGTRTTLTTTEDYEIVLKKINELLKPYFEV